MIKTLTYVRNLLVGVTVMASISAAIGAEGSASPSKRDDKFPETTFPRKTFDGLSGSLVWLDSNGGANTRARDATIWKDFTELTGVKTKADFSDFTKFAATQQHGAAVPWSLVEFDGRSSCWQARDAGYLQKLDGQKIPLNLMEKNAYDDYCLEYARSGAVLTYSTRKWPTSGEHPTEMADLFDKKKFPGKRCLYKGVQFGAVLESALLADGVSRDQLYPLDVKRALKKLDTIKDDIIWYKGGDESLRLFTGGECDLGIAWSGRIYSAVTANNAQLAISWKNAILTSGAYAIPRNAPNPNAGQAALAMWILDKPGQQNYVKLMSYPTAITGIEYPSDLKPWIAVGENASVAIPEDARFFAANKSALNEQFNAWLLSK